MTTDTTAYGTTLAEEAEQLRERLIGKPWSDYWQAVTDEPAGGIVWACWWPIIDSDALITGWLPLDDPAIADHEIVSVYPGPRFLGDGADAAMLLDDWQAYLEPADVPVPGDIDTGWRSRHD